MRVLLLTVPPPSKGAFSTSEKRFPLGLGFLASTLKSVGHEVTFEDFYTRNEMPDMERLFATNPVDVVGIYLTTICFSNFLIIANALEEARRKGLWRGRIIVGGPHTSVAPRTIPDFIDHVVQGEGEGVIVELVEGKINERIVRGKRIEDLDMLPRPDYEIFLERGGQYDMTMRWIKETPVFVMNTSRGCPFPCTFCGVGTIWGKRYTTFSAKRIVNDMVYLRDRHGAEGIYFREDNFTLSRKRVMEFCDEIIRRNLKIFWVCETRVDTLAKNEDMVQRMAECGCRGVFLGVESGSDVTLERLRKKITVEQSKKAIEYCKKYGIRTGLSMMVGIPEETLEDRIETVNFAITQKPHHYWVNVFVGIPFCELYKELEEQRHKGAVYIDENLLLYSDEYDRLVDEIYGGDESRKTGFKKDVDFKQIVAEIKRAKISDSKKQCYLEFVLLQYVKNGGPPKRVLALFFSQVKLSGVSQRSLKAFGYLFAWALMRVGLINILARRIYFLIKIFIDEKRHPFVRLEPSFRPGKTETKQGLIR